MFSVSTSVILVVFFVSQAVGQSTTTVAPRLSQSVKSSPSSAVVSSPYVSSTPKLTSATLSSPLSTALTITSSIITSSGPPTTTMEQPTILPSKKTCAKLGVVIDKSWSDDYGNCQLETFRNASDAFSSALNNLYRDSDKYDDVNVSAVNFANKEGKLSAEAKLSLVFKGGDAVFIEDVFKNKVATGELDADLPVVEYSSEFEPLGVSWKDWKAKEGECKKKCEGAAGEFLIVRECQDARCSCKGLKKSKETKDCPTYCSSTVVVTVSSVILVIGIFLSSSFQ